MRKWVLPGLLGLLLLSTGVLAYMATVQQESLENLESELSDLRSEFFSLDSRTVALEDTPEAEEFDPAEIHAILDTLAEQVEKLDNKLIHAATTDDLIDMAEAIRADRQSDFDFLDGCIDDLIAVSNGNRPVDGLIC